LNRMIFILLMIIAIAAIVLAFSKVGEVSMIYEEFERRLSPEANYRINISGVKVYIISNNIEVREKLIKYLEGLGVIISRDPRNVDSYIIDVDVKLSEENLNMIRRSFLKGKGIMLFSLNADSNKIADLLEKIMYENETIYDKFKDFIYEIRSSKTIVAKTYNGKEVVKAREEHVYAIGVRFEIRYSAFINKTYIRPIMSLSITRSLDKVPEELPMGIASMLYGLRVVN